MVWTRWGVRRRTYFCSGVGQAIERGRLSRGRLAYEGDQWVARHGVVSLTVFGLISSSLLHMIFEVDAVSKKVCGISHMPRGPKP